MSFQISHKLLVKNNEEEIHLNNIFSGLKSVKGVNQENLITNLFILIATFP